MSVTSGIPLFQFTYLEDQFTLIYVPSSRHYVLVMNEILVEHASSALEPEVNQYCIAFVHQKLGHLTLAFDLNREKNEASYHLHQNQTCLTQDTTSMPFSFDVLEGFDDSKDKELVNSVTSTQRSGNMFGLMGLAFKLFKSAKAVKILLAGSALAGWSLLFSWEFALVLIGVLMMHEYGHLWAMKRCGMNPKGIYLIPFVGGMAVADKAETQWQQVFTAMMGPIFGLLMSAACYLVFLLTDLPFIGLVASVSALINVIQLLPILPLDGGQVVKAMVFSGRSYAAYLGLLLGSAVCFALSVHFHLALLSFFIVLGVIDLLFSRQEMKNQVLMPMDRYGIVFSLAWYLVTVVLFVLVIFAIAQSGVPGAEIVTGILDS